MNKPIILEQLKVMENRLLQEARSVRRLIKIFQIEVDKDKLEEEDL